jgi:hypothetical protein
VVAACHSFDLLFGNPRIVSNFGSIDDSPILLFMIIYEAAYSVTDPVTQISLHITPLHARVRVHVAVLVVGGAALCDNSSLNTLHFSIDQINSSW